MKPELIISIISLIFVTGLGFLQWRTAAQRAKSGEALDWSMAANNLRKEIDALRAELQTVKEENKILKELARRLIKSPPEKGDVIILSPLEQSVLFDTHPRFKAAK